MKLVLQVLIVQLSACVFTFAQTPPAQKAVSAKAPSVVPIKQIVDKGAVSGRKYTNEKLNFSILFPDTWVIRENDFPDDMLKQGVDIRLKAPDNLRPADQARINQSLRRVEVLVTASRARVDSYENAILRVSAEDLKPNPQIKDAVDYFDAVRTSYKTIKLPADFKYSETRAEKLGTHQFAYLDISSNAGKKRLYATVRDRFAILFTLSYSTDEDLQSMRQILATGNFRLK
jgi:hypothetical protein